MTEDQPTLTLTLAAQDWQLVMSICQQALLPYQRLGQVLQAMQAQSMEAQKPQKAEPAKARVEPFHQQAQSGLNP